MHTHSLSRRSFLKSTVFAVAAPSLARAATEKAPLMAYVGTFSSPLRDVLPTQVDLPPGNGRGIHLFQADRSTGALTPAGIYESGTSPNCLAVNTAGDRLYSTNETDRVGENNEGTVSAFAINRTDGQLTLLNTVRSGGAGPTYLSIHPSGKFVLVANYFGGPLPCCRFSTMAASAPPQTSSSMPARSDRERPPTPRRAASLSADTTERTRT